jgi:hypothetical protein
LHVAVSFTWFALLPATLSLLLPLLPSHALQPGIMLALLIPTLTYVLLSWIWLIARVLHDLLGGTPRGGHPVATERYPSAATEAEHQPRRGVTFV